MTRFALAALAISALVGCQRADTGPRVRPGGQVETLLEARRGHTPKPVASSEPGEPAPEPPGDVFRLVRYDSPAGSLAAYLTPDPGDGQKRPAIVWITGGDCNSVGDVWSPAPPENDQTAAAYRRAGLVMMFPSLRGGNDNPGRKEAFLGEVDDVLAAADFLAKQPHVDPKRIYLGGHSTGGTLVLLVAECSNRFRAVFSFGPVDDVRGYPPEYAPFDRSDPREAVLRSPIHWLDSIQSPTYVIEGTHESNLDAVDAMKKKTTNPRLHVLKIWGADHFSVLGPCNEVIAKRLAEGEKPNDAPIVTELDLRALFGK